MPPDETPLPIFIPCACRIMEACFPTRDSLELALVTTLCRPSAELLLEPDPRYRFGLFSQLNFLTQQLMEHLYRGDGLAGAVAALYRSKTLLYGGEPLGKHFGPAFTCPPCSHRGHQWTAHTVQAAPRYHLVSRLTRLLLQPRPSLQTAEGGGYRRDAVALHVRRGDKVGAKGRERIALPTRDQLARVALALIRNSSERSMAHASVFIASDDHQFALALAQRLRHSWPALRVDVEPAPRSTTHQACSSACVAPLLQTIERFVHASALVVSLRSNMGGFILSSWSAANADGVPPFVDVDGRVRPKHLAAGARYFCALNWGSRAGLCQAGERFSYEAACAAPRQTSMAHSVLVPARLSAVQECCDAAAAQPWQNASARVAALGCRACMRDPPVCSNRLGDGFG